MTFGQRFARFATTATVRAPALWRVFRYPLTRTFDRLAPTWDTLRNSPDRLAALEHALDAVPGSPARILDVGTGTGSAARMAAARWPNATVTGVDFSAGMIEESKKLGGERYVVGDAAALPFADASFDLVLLNNMIPFFDELARVTAPGGHVAIAFSRGAETPIYVPLDRVAQQLEARGFGIARKSDKSVLATRPERS